MAHFISLAKNAAETLLGVATGDATKVVAGAFKTATSAIPGGTLSHGLIDGVLGNEATALADNPIAREVVGAFVKDASSHPSRTINQVENYLDADDDGSVSMADIRERVTEAFDNNSDGIVDKSDIARDIVDFASGTQDVLGTVGHQVADEVSEMASNALDFLDILDTASNFGA